MPKKRVRWVRGRKVPKTRKEVMKYAQETRRKTGVSMATALTQAWARFKQAEVRRAKLRRKS